MEFITEDAKVKHTNIPALVQRPSGLIKSEREHNFISTFRREYLLPSLK
jgi:hypothetical protein